MFEENDIIRWVGPGENHGRTGVISKVDYIPGPMYRITWKGELISVACSTKDNKNLKKIGHKDIN